MLSFLFTASDVHQMHIGFKVYNKHFRLTVGKKIRFLFTGCSIKVLGYFPWKFLGFRSVISRENGVFL